MKLKRASHCVYQIRYHIVFCIKYRRGLLVVEERCEYLKQVLKEISERYWFEIERKCPRGIFPWDTSLEMGTDGDHIHLFVGAAPKYVPSRVMQILKSISARELFKRFPELRQQLWGGEFWSDGGYIGTVGDGVNSAEGGRGKLLSAHFLEIVKRYIQEQGSEEEKARVQQMRLFPL
jgi:putative transposase